MHVTLYDRQCLHPEVSNPISQTLYILISRKQKPQHMFLVTMIYPQYSVLFDLVDKETLKVNAIID